MKTVLLTGASGFIGFHLASKLLNDGHKVIAPVRKQSQSKLENLNTFENFKAVQGDFFDRELLNKISDKIDVILHFASIRGEGAAAKEYQEVNITGTQSLLEYAKTSNINDFIYCSSVGVLGTIPARQHAKVDQPVNPDNLYHNSKWQSEIMVSQYHSEKLHTCILRPTITYGKGDDGFIPKMIDMVRSGKFPLSSKDVFIHLLDVNAFAKLVSDLVEKGNLKGKTYIVADRSAVLLKKLVNNIKTSIGQNSGFLNVPAMLLNLGEFTLKILRQKKLLTSVQLINQSWTYQIDETIDDLGFQPSDTLQTLNNYLKENNIR